MPAKHANGREGLARCAVSKLRVHSRASRAKILCLIPFLGVVARAENFPPELFPGLAGKSDADIRLAGIAALNPGRILDHDPAPPKPAVPEMRKTLIAELPRGGEYLRLYTLDTEAVKARAGKKPLIVDCRYLATSPEDLDKCLSFGASIGVSASVVFGGVYPGGPDRNPDAGRISKGVLSDKVSSGVPVIVLVNRQTSGPIEAVLAALQSAKKVLLVGANTAGMTGVYKKSGDRWILSGEVKPDDKTSLVGVGATPKFPVTTTPEDEFYAWQLVERGMPLSGVLRHDGLGSTSSAKPAESADTKKPAVAPGSSDAALQRAQDVLSALAVLGVRAGEGK